MSNQAFGTVSGGPIEADHGARVTGRADLAVPVWHGMKKPRTGRGGGGEVSWQPSPAQSDHAT